MLGYYKVTKKRQSYFPQPVPKRQSLSKTSTIVNMPGTEGLQRRMKRRRRKRGRKTLKQQVAMLKKQIGINKPKVVIYDENFRARGEVGKTLWINNVATCALSGARLTASGAPFESPANGTDDRRCTIWDTQKHTIVSNVETPQHVEIYECMVRQNSAITVASFDSQFIVAGFTDSAVSNYQLFPAASIYCNQKFCTFAKIVKTTKYFLEPAKTIYYTFSAKRTMNESTFDPDKSVTLPAGARFLLIKCYGVPVQDVTDNTLVNWSECGLTSIATCQLKWLENIGEDDPTRIFRATTLGTITNAERIGDNDVEMDAVDNS